MEDLCQASGLSSAHKYEQEGGPSLVTTLALVSKHVKNPPADLVRVIEWQAFNVVVGNCDGHGKNLSFVYATRDLALAPFYDLLSTRQYSELDKLLAMSVGGRRDPTELHRPQWEQLAKDAGLGARVVIDTVTSVAQRCLDAIPDWTKEYRELYGRRSILETLPKWITTSARRVLRQLAK